MAPDVGIARPSRVYNEPDWRFSDLLGGWLRVRFVQGDERINPDTKAASDRWGVVKQFLLVSDVCVPELVETVEEFLEARGGQGGKTGPKRSEDSGERVCVLCGVL